MITQQEEILAEAFEHWKQNPITQLMFKRLAELKQRHLESSMVNSANMTIDDKQFRLDAYAAKTVDTVIRAMSDVKLLVGKQ